MPHAPGRALRLAPSPPAGGDAGTPPRWGCNRWCGATSAVCHTPTPGVPVSLGVTRIGDAPRYKPRIPEGALWDGGSFWGGGRVRGRAGSERVPRQVQHAGLHVAQGHALRVHRHRLPGDVRGRGLGRARGAAALHAHRVLRQEALPAQDGEQQTAQDQVSDGDTPGPLSLWRHRDPREGGWESCGAGGVDVAAAAPLIP